MMTSQAHAPRLLGTRAVLIAAGAILLALVPGLLWVAYAARNVQLELGPQGLRLRGSMYARFLPRRALDPAQARLVHLGAEGDPTLASAIHGTSLPGYREGWFRLAGGGEALAFVTRPQDGVCIPTTQGYDLLVTPVRPEIFLASLKAQRRASVSFTIAPSPGGGRIPLLAAGALVAGLALVAAAVREPAP